MFNPTMNKNKISQKSDYIFHSKMEKKTIIPAPANLREGDQKKAKHHAHPRGCPRASGMARTQLVADASVGGHTQAAGEIEANRTSQKGRQMLAEVGQLMMFIEVVLNYFLLIFGGVFTGLLKFESTFVGLFIVLEVSPSALINTCT